MQFLINGRVKFDDIYELYYNLFTTIGLGINQNSYLYDQDTGTMICLKDKFIKASVQPVTIYAGKNDIIFAPDQNYQLMVCLLGYYLDKNPELSFIAQYIEDDNKREKQRVCVKTHNGVVESNFYSNIYLGYIECIFILSGGFIPDLSNFDIVL